MSAFFRHLPKTEWANASTHALGVLLVVAATPGLMIRAAAQGSFWHHLSAGVFAGTLLAVGGPAILAAIWLISVGAMIWKVICAQCAPRLSTGFYMILGWAILAVIGRFDAAMPEGGLHWLLAGGGAYSVGMIFYLWFSLPYHHAVWHVFVILGSACHTVAVAEYSLVCRV